MAKETERRSERSGNATVAQNRDRAAMSVYFHAGDEPIVSKYFSKYIQSRIFLSSLGGFRFGAVG